MVSFSTMTKNELARLEIESMETARVELAAMIQISGCVGMKGFNGLELEIGTENGATSRRIYNLFKYVYDYQPEVEVRRNKNLKRTNKYVNIVSDSDKAREILIDIGILDEDSNAIFGVKHLISDKFKSNQDLKRAYLRGAFLGGGSLSNPEKMYHLEFIANNHEFGNELLELLNSFNLNAKTIERKEHLIVYIKEGEKVVDLLNIVEAHNALLKLEDIRILKEMRNNINRIVNCETANLAKVVNASVRQIQKIEKIRDTIGLESLPDNLRETARLRLENQGMSLSELGQLHRPPVGKSGVNHRLRKLENIADDI